VIDTGWIGSAGCRRSTDQAADVSEASTDAVLDQACSRSLVNGGDHNSRKCVAERLAEAAGNGITHPDELRVVAGRALLELSNRNAI